MTLSCPHHYSQPPLEAMAFTSAITATINELTAHQQPSPPPPHKATTTTLDDLLHHHHQQYKSVRNGRKQCEKSRNSDPTLAKPTFQQTPTLDREVSRGPFLEANRRMARVMGGWRSRGAARGVPKRGVRRGVGLAVGCKAVQVRCEVKGRIARGANRDMRRKMGCVVSRVARSLMRHGVGVVINRA